jgi:hypothetical protein
MNVEHRRGGGQRKRLSRSRSRRQADACRFILTALAGAVPAGPGLSAEELGMKRSVLWKDIVVVLAIKMVLLTGLYVAFFSPSHRTVADPAAVSERLLGSDHR